MCVKLIMKTVVVTVDMDDSLCEVKKIFDNAKFHHLLVVSSDKLVGVISDRDLLKSISPSIGTASETTRDLATLKKKVHQIMSRNPVTINKNAGIDEAINIFNNNNISCLPVLNNQNNLIGIISWRDILKAIEAKQVKLSKTD